MNNIAVHICTKDRPTEVALLLQSLRTQTCQNFNCVILDDGSGTPIINHYFVNYMIERMKQEGHKIVVIRNDAPSGVSSARQQLVDYTMKYGDEKYICRVDDDVLLEPNYLDELIEVIYHGYDLASGITVPFVGMPIVRDINSIGDVIGECQLNDKGELILNMDDCVTLFTEKKILPTHHFRSCALYKKELHEAGVDYINKLSRNGFREEQILSFKAILKGFKLGVNTMAINYHLQTPSGGEKDTMNMCGFNQDRFEETTKRMFEDYGDFIEKYNKKLGIKTKRKTDLELMHPLNLVSKKLMVSLIE